jgi:hypothetical protein
VMFCHRLTPRFHLHRHVPAKRLGFVKARTPRVNDWGYLGRRWSIWWSSVDRAEHWKVTGLSKEQWRKFIDQALKPSLTMQYLIDKGKGK